MEFGFITNYIFNFFKQPQQQQQEEQEEEKEQEHYHTTPNTQQPSIHHTQTIFQQPPNQIRVTKKPLPTAFIPNFPSLAQPSQPTQYVPPASSAAKTLSTRNSRRRTLYLGPGHSLLSNSTRLANARRNRLARAALLAHHSPPSESPKQLTSPQPSSSKRIRQNQLPPPQPNSAVLATPQATPQPTTSLHRPSLDNPALKNFKNHAGTPIRPSPLRNVTLPSVTSSPPQRLRSESFTTDLNAESTPKKRKHKQASSIMSSVMKEVNKEMQSRSPAPSPIKPAEVINPYSNLERPIKRKRHAVNPAPPPPPSKSSDPTEIEYRKRKIQVCLEGNLNDRPDKGDHVEDEADNDPMKHILQQTMPKEYRQETSNGVKRKTRQVGKLPERLLKKQKMREQIRSSQTPDPPTKTTPTDPPKSSSEAHVTNGPTESRLSGKSNDADADKLIPAKAAPSQATKASSSTFASGKTNGTPGLSGGRTTPSPKPTEPTTTAHSDSASVPAASPAAPASLFGGPSAFASKSFSNGLSSFSKRSAPETGLSLFSKPTPTVTLTAADSGQAGDECQSTPEDVTNSRPQPTFFTSTTPAGDQADHPDRRFIMDKVLALNDDEVFSSFDHDLLRLFAPPATSSHSNHQAIKQTVLGFAPSELGHFAFS